MASPAIVLDLVKGWYFREAGAQESSWLSVDAVPTCVHLDLMAHGIIGDPFLEFNELDAEWVGEKAWEYKIILPEHPMVAASSVVVLAFDGLDTFATVKLDNKVILRSDNMFIPHRIDVKRLLLATTGPHELTIEFESAVLKARSIRAQHPEHKWLSINADSARLAIRKSQFSWGWDWGPFLNQVGPWRPVRFEIYDTRTVDLWTEHSVDAKQQRVIGSCYLHIEGTGGVDVVCNLSYAGKSVWSTIITSTKAVSKVDFIVEDAQLWYPCGYGKQPLYEISVDLIWKETLIDRRSKRIGFRQVELVQTPDSVGKAFYFRINGIEIFCGGSNWIPADSFVTRISKERYYKWIRLLAEGNQVMTRAWAGGIWESHDFYDACDEMGVMVWQDFLFSCGNYPATEEFLASVRKEAIANVKRLRHHCSIVVFAGNNEDYQVQEQFGLTYHYADKNASNWLKTDFPARYIYEKILPEVMKSECPSIPYHPGSPWGDGKPTSDPTVGDMHQWNVWHGTQEKYQIFDSLGGRFNSEFGMEAFPHFETIKYFCKDETQLYPQSQVIDFHNKAAGHERRLATYIVENFRLQTDLKAFIHLTQLVQSEALMFGYRGWRKRWGQERLCGGALVWQLNDCWPTISWSIVDYFMRKKPAYYALKRVLAPIAIGVQRAHHDWSVVHARPVQYNDYELWVVSSQTRDITGTVELRFISVETGRELKPRTVKDIRILANGTTPVLSGLIDNFIEEPHVLAARIWVDGEIVARDIDWPQPLKYLSFRNRGLKVETKHGQIKASVLRPLKGLVFEEQDGTWLDDNALDIVPGDDQVINVQGLTDIAWLLSWRFVGQEEDQRHS